MPTGHRRSIRLHGYDYHTAGAYFVTICTEDRIELFGRVADGVLEPNDCARMIEHWWKELTNRYPGVDSAEFVVMPNHVHGILWLREPEGAIAVGAALCGRPRPTDERKTGPMLGQAIGWFKTMTTNAYIRGVKERGWRPFPGRIWQRDYYEHVIGNDNELNQTRQYIARNPEQWAEVEYNAK